MNIQSITSWNSTTVYRQSDRALWALLPVIGWRRKNFTKNPSHSTPRRRPCGIWTSEVQAGDEATIEGAAIRRQPGHPTLVEPIRHMGSVKASGSSGFSGKVLGEKEIKENRYGFGCIGKGTHSNRNDETRNRTQHQGVRLSVTTKQYKQQEAICQ